MTSYLRTFRIFSVLAIACAVLPAFASDDAAFAPPSFAFDFDRWHAGAGASTVLPQGGSKMRRLAGGEVKTGYYITEMWTVEAGASWMENTAGLSAGFLWHWWGYERLDPFFTYGAKGWLDGCGAGPYAGAGAFWNIDDFWSLRFETDAAFLLGSGDGYMAYSFGVSVRRTF